LDEKLIFKDLNTLNAPQFAGHFLFCIMYILRRNLCLVLLFAFSTTNAQQWWANTSIYQIYPRSFYDTNADDIGDINGIIQRLDYIKSLGFETIWCFPFFSSPQQDFGYDISDYREISIDYGSMDDVDELIREVHKRKMRIVFDMVMNHTSAKHQWFLKDERKQNNGDFYIWAEKPNNWKSMTGGSGWHYSPIRKQYFWASFLPFQPDLNYRNPEVKRVMLDNVRFWLTKGVDGFRLDIFNVIYKDSLLRDNPFSWKMIPSETNPDGFFQQMKYTINQPESFELAKELRAVCNEFGDKMLIGEVSGDRKTIREYLGDEKKAGLGLVFNFEMLRFKFSATYFAHLLVNQESEFKVPFSPVYVFSNHDRRRSVKRLKNDLGKVKLLQMFQLTIRGVPCVYYGEEIGMTDGRISYKNGLDPIAQKNFAVPRLLTDMAGETLNRDDVRTPMQWSAVSNAGFTKAQTSWLPVNKDYVFKNVLNQQYDSASLLNSVIRLLKFRDANNAIKFGSLQIENEFTDKSILCFNRTIDGKSVWVVLNFCKTAQALPAFFKTRKLVFNLNQVNGSAADFQITSFNGLIFE